MFSFRTTLVVLSLLLVVGTAFSQGFTPTPKSPPGVRVTSDMGRVRDCPEVLLIGTDHGIYRSTDFGQTWSYANGSPKGTPITAIWIKDGTGTNEMINTRGEHFLSSDCGETWYDGYPPPAPNLEITSACPSGDAILAGTTTGTVWRYNGVIWTEVTVSFSPSIVRDLVSLGDGTVIAATSDGMYTSANDGAGPYSRGAIGSFFDVFVEIDRSSDTPTLLALSGTRIQRSTNSGASWFTVFFGTSGDTLRTIFKNALGYLFATRKGGNVVISTNGGGFWSTGTITGDIPDPTFISCAIPVDEVAFIGTDGCGMYTTSLSTSNFTQGTTGTTSPITGIVSVPHFSGTPILLSTTAGGGVIKSNDNGANWTPANTGLTDLEILAMVFVGDPATIIIATSSGIFVSFDYGDTWEESDEGLTELDISALFTLGNTVWAGTEGGSLFRSNDQGSNWELVASALAAFKITSILSYFSGAGTDVITIVATGGGGLFKSTDGGATFSPANSGLPNLNATSLSMTQQDLFEDDLAEYFLYVALANGGLFETDDDAATWTQSNTGLGNLNVNATSSVSPRSSVLIAATNAGAYIRYGITQAFSSIGTGLSASPATSVKAIAGAVAGQVSILVGTLAGEIFRSTISASNAVERNTGLNGTANTIVVDPANPNTVYAGVKKGGVFKSTNAGTSWSRITNGLTNFLINYLTAGTGSYAGYLFLATDKGLFYSPNSGLTWIATSGLPNQLVRWVFHTAAGLIYVGTPLGVFFTSTPGGFWTQATNGLLNTDVRSFEYDPFFDIIYVGTTSGGLYKTSDGGNNWAGISAGLPPLQVAGIIVFHVAENYLLAALSKIAGGSGTPGVYQSVNEGPWTQSTISGGSPEAPGNFARDGSGGVYTHDQSTASSAAARISGLLPAGVLRSTDNGLTFEPVNPNLTDTDVRSLAIGSNDNVYIGTPSGMFSAPANSLPVQLASFTGRWHTSNRSVLLEWQTITETNNFGFFVQRRSNEQSFTNLPNSFVPGHGTTLEPQYYSFVDSTIQSGQLYFYRLRQVDLDGTVHYSEPIQISTPTSVNNEALPQQFALFQNYPNPFNPTTRLKFDIPENAFVSLKIFDVLGREVATLVNERKAAGAYSASFDGANFSSGVYIYRLTAGSFSTVKKMVLAK